MLPAVKHPRLPTIARWRSDQVGRRAPGRSRCRRCLGKHSRGAAELGYDDAAIRGSWSAMSSQL